MGMPWYRRLFRPSESNRSLQEGSSRELRLLAQSGVYGVGNYFLYLLLNIVIRLVLGWRDTGSLLRISGLLLHLSKVLCKPPKVNPRFAHVDTLLLLFQ